MSGKVQNLGDGNAKALQALLQSLSPDLAAEGGGKLSADAVQKLSAKLEQLVGNDIGEPQQRNEEGQLLNEEGLPIIDITEPLQVSETQIDSVFLDENAPSPLSALPPSEKERRERERDRILDLLEQEEEMEQAREDGLSQEQRQEILRKRKLAAQDEAARLKASKEMQKKMGKALLKDMAASRDKHAPVQTPAANSDIAVEEAIHVPRKTVKFADAADEVDVPVPREESPDWGDVVPARLRAKTAGSLMSKAHAQFDAQQPMKMQVVERMPGKPRVEETQPDSDDESEPPDSPLMSDSDEEGRLESDEELAEEVDLDYAQHQREITLEYHTRRAKMAETTSSALRSHSHDPLVHKTAEESLTQSSRKPAISHFQADRLTSSYNAVAPSSSTSLGANVLPASSAQTLQRAIRVGKLDSDDRLVGGEAGESGSEDEDDAVMQEIVELLKKGEVYNLGPDGDFIHTVPPPKPPATEAPPVAAPMPLPPTSRKPPTSKFKLARAGQRPFSAPSASEVSDSSTPTSTVARSSPKLPSMAESRSTTASVLSSTVVEKPSAAFTSMIIDSPSFPGPPSTPETRRPQQPPTVVRAADKPGKVSRFLAERM
ncbi:hypothetical protein C8F04DRAFT_1062683 [Mycena alexandri]|uniref:DUF3835 domain-containing protein n=1 Tax=Mycena alexandri TaxID=1745969 RepID=A0AAD6TMX3_9AGAR|nr:hypothetical protein C8F04DRAFT_1062683 [Mycena alexandri]